MSDSMDKKSTMDTLRFEDLPELMTTVEVAGFLRVGQGTVKKSIKEDKLRAVKYGRGWRVKKWDLKEFLKNL